MRMVVAAALFAGVLGAGSASAQGGAFMWCSAAAETGGETAHYYSAFFSAGAWEADRKALAFSNAIKKDHAPDAKITATCAEPADYQAVVAARNAAMKAAPGKVLSWEG